MWADSSGSPCQALAMLHAGTVPQPPEVKKGGKAGPIGASHPEPGPQISNKEQTLHSAWAGDPDSRLLASHLVLRRHQGASSQHS